MARTGGTPRIWCGESIHSLTENKYMILNELQSPAGAGFFLVQPFGISQIIRNFALEIEQLTICLVCHLKRSLPKHFFQRFLSVQPDEVRSQEMKSSLSCFDQIID
jgi:hypothetical protein